VDLSSMLLTVDYLEEDYCQEGDYLFLLEAT